MAASSGPRQGLEYGATPSPENYFQARYAIRHWWTGPITCENPVRGVWGGPPNGNYQPTIAASKLAFAPRGRMALDTVIKRDLWEINYKKAPAQKPTAPATNGTKFATPPGTKAMGLGVGVLLGLMLLGAGSLVLRRKR